MLYVTTFMTLTAAICLVNASLNSPPASLNSPPATLNSPLAALDSLTVQFFSESPPCVQECLLKHYTTEMSPCPKWDAQCLCKLPSSSDIWMKCVLEACPQFARDVKERASTLCEKALLPEETSVSLSDPVKTDIGKKKSQASDVTSREIQLKGNKKPHKSESPIAGRFGFRSNSTSGYIEHPHLTTPTGSVIPSAAS